VCVCVCYLAFEIRRKERVSKQEINFNVQTKVRLHIARGNEVKRMEWLIVQGAYSVSANSNFIAHTSVANKESNKGNLADAFIIVDHDLFNKHRNVNA
jgi:hypothetical protein